MRRKLTTLVAVDMVGYARLMGEDEKAVLTTLDQLRNKFLAPKTEHYGGRIIHFIGDGSLLEFESALEAVEFALDLQISLSERNIDHPQELPIVLRIGINLGDVIIENEEIHGDGVNIAVRIEALSEPGGICLSESVYTQVKNKLQERFVSMGPRSLKNIADPVQIWRWRPSISSRSQGSIERLIRGSGPYRGQHVLDPRLVDLLLRLHMRSAILAVSNALDQIIGEDGEARRMEQLYQFVGKQLHEARQLLNNVRIERSVGTGGDAVGPANQQALGEFVLSLFNDGEHGYAFRILPEAQAIMATPDSFIVKRKRLMELIRQYYNEEFIVRSRSLIEYAYIE